MAKRSSSSVDTTVLKIKTNGEDVFISNSAKGKWKLAAEGQILTGLAALVLSTLYKTFKVQSRFSRVFKIEMTITEITES